MNQRRIDIPEGFRLDTAGRCKMLVLIPDGRVAEDLSCVLKANEEKTEERERFLTTAITTGLVAK